MPRLHNSSRQDTIHDLLLASGIVGPSLFIVTMLAEGATRSGYNPWTQTISALSLSSAGWLQVINFLVCGLLILSFGVGVRSLLTSGRGKTWGPLLIAAVGIGLIMAGIFTTDPALGYPPGTPPGPAIHTSVHGILHWILGGLIVFSCLPAACFVFARRWASSMEWKIWSVFATIAGILTLAFFIVFGAISMHQGPGGLFERLSFISGMAWMILFAARLLIERVAP